ncbi:intraflagellar transport protein 122 homolog isoform X2 [Selaginella moellendorffii]|uniref:intraflagellar transport protein 122 homolog isoform X2 n=1 Tax=Selaginella moellendorffii TaxID=88036 RepID=UPI000D1C977A|nr:intraflagellar transport protein 122 homolog isoform X2 [Selaginella moellendorffii]|eukprot:XP_024523366.1 intraflagellar transport protein 122 homolog isoform X2 [Selaginella moellendorffii]
MQIRGSIPREATSSSALLSWCVPLRPSVAMRVVVAWADHAPEHLQAPKAVCYDLAFRPDGSQLIAAVGSRVLMYDAATGDLLHSLKGGRMDRSPFIMHVATLAGHKGAVYCLAYSRDGKRFASGGADKTIIVWTYKAEGILKYSHAHSIQCLAYNPVTQQLASGTASDFGIWSPEQKSVLKHTTVSKVLCASWTKDGQILALGMFTGHVYLCDRFGNEQAMIEKSSPVWSLQWNVHNRASDTLAVACWDGTLTFFNISGKQFGRCTDLGFDPCSISYTCDGRYLCVAGSGRKVELLSNEGIQLTTICETSDWVWAVRSHPKADYVAVGCNDGSISMLQLVFSMVHSLYQERYAYRDTLTSVVVQNLISNEKVRIKCHDYVKKIAVYQNNLAIQMPTKIIVYQLHGSGLAASDYQVRAKLNGRMECNLLVLTSRHFILCHETELQLYSLSGTKEREWFLESSIRYIKVCGGPVGGEGLLVGTKAGQVVRLWINNAFAVNLYSHKNPIRCLDLSASGSRLAIVDEMSNLVVYDLQSRTVCYEETSASSVAWNTKLDSMLCYSGNGMLSIKTADFPVHRQKLQGNVVGFQGSRMFSLQNFTMQTVEVPQSTSMRQYLRTGDYQNAYRVACMGVTEMDWRELALEAMKGQDWKVARAGFMRLRDVPFLDLLSHAADYQPCHLAACTYAFQGDFEAAAQAYCESGEVDKAMEMYADLRMFEKAKALAECIQNKDQNNKANVRDIIQRQAEWTEETNDHNTAVDMYIIAGQPQKALSILAAHGPALKLIEVSRRLNKSDIQELKQCASLMHRHGLYTHALETYTKLSDFRSTLLLHIELEQWEEAFTVKKLHPELQEDVNLPYAQWLISRDRFEDAHLVYRQAGRPDLSERLFAQLIENAVKEKRFKDAAHSSWLLGMDGKSEDEEHRRLRLCADIYYAYSYIDQSISEPFRTTLPETLIGTARFVLARIPRNSIAGVSVANILVTLARHGEQLGAHDVAKEAYEHLRRLRVPSSWADKLEAATLASRARAFGRTIGPSVCFICSGTSPFVSYFETDSCAKCRQPKFWSFLTFRQLPVVQVFLKDGITHQQALELLQRYNESDVHGTNVEYLGLQHNLHTGRVYMDDKTLSKLQASQFFAVVPTGGATIQARYFISLEPSLSLFQCPSCEHFFELEEWDFTVLRHGCCAFCRNAM